MTIITPPLFHCLLYAPVNEFYLFKKIFPDILIIINSPVAEKKISNGFYHGGPEIVKIFFVRLFLDQPGIAGILSLIHRKNQRKNIIFKYERFLYVMLRIQIWKGSDPYFISNPFFMMVGSGKSRPVSTPRVYIYI